jgi:anti-sigma-K factor RskA
VSEHERYDELVAPYLLGALAPVEHEDFEAHLTACAECRAEVELLRVGVESLPGSVPQVEPPPELRDRIMAVVHREAELLAAAGPEADRPPARAATPWWRRLRLLAPVTAAVAAALLAVVVIGGGEDLRTIEAAQAPAGAMVRMHVGDEHSTLVAERLPDPPRGRVYQVWLKRPGRDPEPTRALFSPSDSGTVSVDVPGSMDGVEGVLVTDEPMGGSETPTRDPVIALTTA